MKVAPPPSAMRCSSGSCVNTGGAVTVSVVAAVAFGAMPLLAVTPIAAPLHWTDGAVSVSVAPPLLVAAVPVQPARLNAPLLIAVPLRVQTNAGVGVPVASTPKVAVPPALVVCASGGCVMLGAVPAGSTISAAALGAELPARLVATTLTVLPLQPRVRPLNASRPSLLPADALSAATPRQAPTSNGPAAIG